MKNPATGSRLTGTRLRERRLGRGVRQSDLARSVGISPAYLNLIEHNKRRIGGKLLVELARALGAEPGELSEGAEVALLGVLSAAAARQPKSQAELAKVEEFAGRFPGWSRVVAGQHGRMRELERLVEALSDRLTHDPHLAATLHDVLSSVTAIHAAVSILTGDEDIDADWQARFLRNVAEDSTRLTESAQGLAAFLEADHAGQPAHRSPQDELSGFLDAHEYYFPTLESAGADFAAAIAAEAASLQSGVARELATSWLGQYAADAAALPEQAFRSIWAECDQDPVRCAASFGVGVAAVLRRAACLQNNDEGGGFGLVVCDGSGSLTTRKQLPGFVLPRFGAACPRWPLFQALTQPGRPIRAGVEMPGDHRRLFTCMAISEAHFATGINGLPVHEATMLIMPADGSADAAEPPVTIGPGCRVCSRAGCPARREPSLLALEA